MKKKILFQLTGSIAAYKACQVISKLAQAGHDVQVVASPAALEFVGKPTLEGLSGRAVVSDLWESGRAMDHIHLVRWADLIVMAPASANSVNKLAQGVGDDLITTMALAHDFTKPFLIAPAMNTAMYAHPTTQANLRRLSEIGYQVLKTGAGNLACGEQGSGRLLEPPEILAEIEKYLEVAPSSANATATRFQGTTAKPLRVLITAGGTEVPIDAVRSITNTSSGRTGARLARYFTDLGHQVTLLTAKAAELVAFDGDVERYVTVDDLQAQLRKLLGGSEYDVVIQAAAVSDFQVVSIEQGSSLVQSSEPISKLRSDDGLTLKLKPGPKVIKHLREWSRNPRLKVVGFKLTSTDSESERAIAVRKVFANPGVTLVVHNDQNEIKDGQHPFRVWSSTENSVGPLAGAEELADALLQELTLGGT